jgi:tetratricopeptide (TPR) repeat protein
MSATVPSSPPLRLNRVMQDASSHVVIGGLLLEQGRYADAIHEFELAVRDGNEPTIALVGIGNAYAGQKDNRRAETAYRRALALNPDYDAAHQSLGVLLFGERRYAEAERHFAMAVALKPDLASARLGLAAVLFALGRHQDAARESERATGDDSFAPMAWYQRGHAHQALGKLDEAAADFQQILRRYPRMALPYLRLGDVYGDQGKFDQAVIAYEMALVLNPVTAQAHWRLGQMYAARGRWAEAIHHYQAELLLVADGVDPNAGAMRFDTPPVFQRPEAPVAVVHYDLADALRAVRRLEEAAAAYREAIARDETMAPAVALVNERRALDPTLRAVLIPLDAATRVPGAARVRFFPDRRHGERRGGPERRQHGRNDADRRAEQDRRQAEIITLEDLLMVVSG